jgi:hypothetical protein
LFSGGGEGGVDTIAKDEGSFLGNLLPEYDAASDFTGDSGSQLAEVREFDDGFACGFPANVPDVKGYRRETEVGSQSSRVAYERIFGRGGVR